VTPATALIVVDMLNTYEHEDADRLRESVRRTLPAFKRLLEAQRDSDGLLVYVNDNYGQWHVGPRELVEQARRSPHHDLVDPIMPGDHTPFVVKARHSIFYQTLLEYMLRRHDVSRLILAGQVTEQCILYSAIDAYVRHFEITVCSDAVASIDQQLGNAALEMMRRNLHAEITRSTEFRL
jgi:nicotinamidase-related amidase